MRILNNNELELCSGGALVSDGIWGDFDYEGSTTIGGLLGGKPMDALRGLIGGVLIGGTGGAWAGMKLAVSGGFIGGFIAEVVGTIYGALVGGIGGGAMAFFLGSEYTAAYGWKYLNDVLGGNI